MKHYAVCAETNTISIPNYVSYRYVCIFMTFVSRCAWCGAWSIALAITRRRFEKPAMLLSESAYDNSALAGRGIVFIDSVDVDRGSRALSMEERITEDREAESFTLAPGPL